MQLVLSLLQQMSVSLVIAYLFSKVRCCAACQLFGETTSQDTDIHHLFQLLHPRHLCRPRYRRCHRQHPGGRRRVGGCWGPAGGISGGIDRWSAPLHAGGFTDLACAISTTCEGLLGGVVHWRLMRAGRTDALFQPRIAFFTTLYAEIMQMLIILLVATPFDKSLLLVRTIATPMILANSCGAALFISMIRDQQQMYEKFSRVFSAKALNIANRTVGIMSQGFTPEASSKIARIIQEETGVGAVAITDTEKILAFIGTGKITTCRAPPLRRPSP